MAPRLAKFRAGRENIISQMIKSFTDFAPFFPAALFPPQMLNEKRKFTLTFVIFEMIIKDYLRITPITNQISLIRVNI